MHKYRNKKIAIYCVFSILGFSTITDTSQASPDNVSPIDNLIGHIQKLPSVKEAGFRQDQYGPGVRIVTRHYQIDTTLLDPLVLTPLPAFMESAYHAYQSQLPAPVDTQFKFKLVLFADRVQWEKFTREFTGDHAPVYLAIQKGAYYLNGLCVAYHIGISRTFSALGHEGWHQFSHRHFTYRLPSWLDEGIATQFEASADANGRFIFQPPQNLLRLGELRRTVEDGRLMSLDRLITLNPGQVLNDSDRTSAFYAQAYALVRFLREDHYGIRYEQYRRLLHDGLKGKWPLEAEVCRMAADRNIQLTADFNRHVSQQLFDFYIQSDTDTLEKEYRSFCRKIVYYIRIKREYIEAISDEQ
ncbi:MAG: DUF1570 domain-containing protein [Sedimentisphaerales bacterium]|nr:DUF1570 domain-containing protein [Sedimentisphaerales bacterium]